MPRCYECVCEKCHKTTSITFKSEPFPEIGEVFNFQCKICGENTAHTRVLTRKAMSELKQVDAEKALKNNIEALCAQHNFTCRFLYQSVIIQTAISSWCFDYHKSKKTLYHESTVKINFETGDPCFAHIQFKNRKVSTEEIIEYIASHDAKKQAERNNKVDNPGL